MPIKTEVQVICETLAGMWKAEGELANVSSRHVSGIRRDAAKIEKELSTYIRNFLAEWNSDTSSDMPTIIECVNSGGVNAGCDVFTACPDEDGRCENCAARYLKECKRDAEIHAQETAAFLTAPTMAGCLGLMGQSVNMTGRAKWAALLAHESAIVAAIPILEVGNEN